MTSTTEKRIRGCRWCTTAVLVPSSGKSLSSRGVMLYVPYVAKMLVFLTAVIAQSAPLILLESASLSKKLLC